MKIALIIGLIIAGLVVDLGGGPNGDRLGFRYWRTPGAFNTATLITAVKIRIFAERPQCIAKTTFKYVLLNYAATTFLAASA